MNSVANGVQMGFKFLIVSRHPQRFDEVAALIEQHVLRVSRRSEWMGGPAASDEAMNADVWLGDSLGEMALYYGLSDACLVGGSFAPLGGQNLIEAACGCPVVMGPHTFNFSEAAGLAEAEGAALRVADMAEAVRAGLGLVRDSAALAQAVAAGLAFAARNRGGRRFGRWRRCGSICHQFDLCSLSSNARPPVATQFWLANGMAPAHTLPGQQSLKISIPTIDRLAGGLVQRGSVAAGGDRMIYENLARRHINADHEAAQSPVQGRINRDT